MSWFYLILAGICEIVWVVASKHSNGLTYIPATIITVIGYSLSMILLTKALHSINMSTAYAIWMAIGVVGVCLYGAVFLSEALCPIKVICILMIVIGVLGLRILT